MPLAVAARYARALVEVVVKPGSGLDAQQARAQLRNFEAVVRQSAELRTVLLSPAVQASRKRAVVSRLAESLGVSRPIRNFLCVVIDHRRIAVLEEIREAFEQLLDERTGVVRADVASAQELSEPQRSEIADVLGRLTGKGVRMEFSVDAGLLGGVKARIGSTIYDGSVRGRMKELRRQLVSE